MFDVIQGELTTVGLVLGGLLLVAFMARRLQPLLGRASGYEGALKHLGTLTLTPQCSVSLVQVGKETLVLGLTPQSISFLAKTSALGGQGSCENGKPSATEAGEGAAASPAPLS